MKSYFDVDNGVEYINLQPYLDIAYKDCQYYLASSELNNISNTDKKNLNIHFILTQIFFICKQSKHKKCFYYQLSKINQKHLCIKKFCSSNPFV